MPYLMLCAALLPAVVLLVFIYRKDRYDKEPPGLLIGLLLGGVATAALAIPVESFLLGVADQGFSGEMIDQNGEIFFRSVLSYYTYQFIKNFFVIALTEEGLKWLVLFLFTRNSKHFNSYFDGVIYAVFISLGFAAIENVLYVFNLGWSAALARAVLSVPGHMFNAVFMGFFYSTWHILSVSKRMEGTLQRDGVLPYGPSRFRPGKSLALSLAVPVLVHGFYDFCCSLSSLLSTGVFLLFIVILYIYCFRKIARISKNDCEDLVLALATLYQAYPGIGFDPRTVPCLMLHGLLPGPANGSGAL